MTFEFDDAIRVGGVTVAALAKRSVHCGSWHAVSVCGAKHPVAVLIRRDEETMAFEVDGPRISLDDLEQRFPGQRAEFERRATTDSPHSR